MYSREAGEVEFLADEGVPVEEEPNKRLRELEVPVKKFANVHLNEVPESQELAEVLPHMRRLHTALRSSEADGVHEKQADYAWGSLAEASAAIAKIEGLCCHEEAGAFVRTVLLEASGNRVPAFDSDADERFLEASWGKPAARIDAAAGLMTILQHPSCEDPDVLAAVERLVVDPAPCVRWQIASRLLVRYPHDSDWTWRMIERMARDRSPGVLRGLVKGPLSSLKFEEPARVARITIGIQEAVADARELANSCGNILADLFVWGRDEAASAVIDGLADNPVAHLEKVTHLVQGFREILVSGAIDPRDPETDAARGRSWSFLLRVTRGAAAEFRRGMEREEDTHDVAEDGPSEEQMQDLAGLLECVGWNIYFASGAHDGAESPGAHDGAESPGEHDGAESPGEHDGAESPGEHDGAESPGEQVLRRFHAESGKVIDELAGVGLPQLSATTYCKRSRFLSLSIPAGCFRELRALSAGDGWEAISTTRWRRR